MATLVDTHCHLDYIAGQTDHPDGAEGTDLALVMERAMAEGLGWLVIPSVHPEKFEAVMAVAERFDNVYAAFAVHPTDVQDVKDTPDWLAQVERYLSHPKVVAIGETGLDYYWDTSHAEWQQTCFKQLLMLGVQHDLPVIVHNRDAHDDVYRLISDVPEARGIMHCFSGDAAFAEKMVATGFYISFAGNVTFKNAKALHEAAKETPLDWILIETDSPFLSPVPFRGKPNEPARVRYVAEKIAELKGISYEEVALATTRNAHRVFGIGEGNSRC